VRRLRDFGDGESADLLQTIHDEEISHVAAGRRWFVHLCAERGEEPVALWQELVGRHFRGGLKRPFNTASRQLAGFGPEYYEPITPEIDRRPETR
jgi:uncharacterized ferritin-like protein (DUF455 family)